MPTISVFYGILIKMYWNEHAPPHFHAEYGEYEALINIQTLEIVKGELPRGAAILVKEWAFWDFPFRVNMQGLTVRPELVEGGTVKPIMVRQAHHERLNLKLSRLKREAFFCIAMN